MANQKRHSVQMRLRVLSRSLHRSCSVPGTERADGLHTAALAMLFTIAALVPFARADTYAVLVGVNDYRADGVSDLHYAESDVERVRDALARYAGVAEKNMRVLLGRNAGRQDIAMAIKGWLSDKTTAEDTVLFYFSGHGAQIPDDDGDEEDGLDEALWVWDSSKTLGLSLIRDDDLNRWLSALPAENKLVLLDCCHSGTASKTMLYGGNTPKYVAIDASQIVPPSQEEQRVNESELDAVARSTYPERDESIAPATINAATIMELAACRPEQLALESQVLRHGVLTYYVVEGLASAADSDIDGNITLGELHRYTTQQIKEHRYLQAPQLHGQDSANFIVARVADRRDTASVERAAPSPVDDSLAVNIEVTLADDIEQKTSPGVLDQLSQTGADYLAGLRNVRVVGSDQAPDATILLNAAIDSQEGESDKTLTIALRGQLTITGRYIDHRAGSSDTAYFLKGVDTHDVGQVASRLLDALVPRLSAAVAHNAMTSLRNLDASMRLALTGPDHLDIGDTLELTIQPTQDCYVVLVDVATDGSLHVLFPNSFAPDNFVRAGQRVHIPSNAWRMRIGGPPGIEVIKAIATTQPIALGDISLSAMQAEQVYELAAGATPDTMQRLAEILRSYPVSDWAVESIAFVVGSWTYGSKDPLELNALE